MPSNAVGTVIIGGGIAGVALAYYLADLGEADILVVDADELASGCTGGSMGGVRQQFSTPLEVELAIRGREFWRTFEETFGHPCVYRQEGYLMLTGREEIWERLGMAAEVQKAHGAANVSMLEAHDLSDLVPWLGTAGLIGGCWTPEDGKVTPTDGVSGLATEARKLGVRFLQHTPILRIEKHRADWRLHTAGVPISARRVIVAAGLGSPALVAHFGVDLPITPAWVHYAVTTPVLEGECLPLTIDLDTGLCVEREQDGALVTMLVGNAVGAQGVDAMLTEFGTHAAYRAPVFTDVGVRTTVSAAADATGGDGHAFIGEIDPRLWVLAGFDGHGTMQGPAAAKFTANLIAGIPDAVIDPAAFHPRREITGSREWLRAEKK